MPNAVIRSSIWTVNIAIAPGPVGYSLACGTYRASHKNTNTGRQQKCQPCGKEEHYLKQHRTEHTYPSSHKPEVPEVLLGQCSMARRDYDDALTAKIRRDAACHRNLLTSSFLTMIPDACCMTTSPQGARFIETQPSFPRPLPHALPHTPLTSLNLLASASSCTRI